MSAIKREEVIGPCRLLLGDCLDILPALGNVDAVVTDPPYGIGFSYDTHHDDPRSYPEMMRSVVSAASDLGPHTQAYWQGMLNADRWHEWFPPGFRLYAACKGFVQIRPVAVQYSWDPVVFWTIRKGEKGKSSRDWSLQSLAPFGAGRWKNPHPCPRPPEQCAEVVTAMSLDGDAVLDPFMGSGTTGVACVRLGRRFTGIEIDETYFDIACERIRKAVAQPDMFVDQPAAPTPTQEALL